ncbi:MAG: hypothetical protein M1838_001449 [Thelocarpon superellum]|nr:MAG: hypothetical protein M1838_001449 [Thelocarpon superellum]
MATWNPTFVVAVLVLLYLSSFIVFALLRIITGISIQRLGYFSLRRIAYTPRDGLRINIRGLGLVLHRPTFAQPTWLSLVLEELHVTVDLTALSAEQHDAHDEAHDATAPGTPSDADGPNCSLDDAPAAGPSIPPRGSAEPRRSRTWERLSTLKDRIKRLHRQVQWMRLVDVVATSSTFAITDIGALQVDHFTLAVDTRRKTADRARLFRDRHAIAGTRRPAEWMLTVRSVLFTPEAKESLEIIDHCALNIHGLLYDGLDGLHDAAIAFKCGRVHVPYDDFVIAATRIRHCRSFYGHRSSADDPDLSLADVMEELDMPGSREETIMQTVSDSKEFVGSILRGIKEVQFAIAFFALTKQLHGIRPAAEPLHLNLEMKEVGIDLHRLDQRSPAHRMYFSTNDVAHQALLAAIGMSFGVDDGTNADRLVYVPMLTTTVKTTLPAKTVQSGPIEDVADRNANILFANIVATSPSMDVDPRHLPLLLALLSVAPADAGATLAPAAPAVRKHHHLISRLLPKASIRLSVHEPVIRVTLPAMEPERRAADDYDLLISSNSSIAMELESSHAATGPLHYSLGVNLRVLLHQFYYQTASGIRYNLLMTESLEIKVQVSAAPQLCVVVSGNLQTFSVHMVRPEISEGVRQIVKQLRRNVSAHRGELPPSAAAPAIGPSFLRRVPPWLLSLEFHGSDFGIEVAGSDPDVSCTTRGIALQLESWTAEYRTQRHDALPPRTTRRRAASRGAEGSPAFLDPAPPPIPPSPQVEGTDGRRLAIHVRQLEGFVVEAVDARESESFLSLPRCEVAWSTSTDHRGPILHVHSVAKTLFLHYSLYRHYATGVAGMVLKKAFYNTPRDRDRPRSDETHRAAVRHTSQTAVPVVHAPDAGRPMPAPELTVMDVKVGLVQLKATMPSDPPMMLHLFSLEASRHRWTAPMVKAAAIRLFAEAPTVRGVWARLVTLKDARVDVRESRRQGKHGVVHERSIDVTAEAIRIGVPHQLVPHKIFDNAVNVAKATEQLHHRFKTGTNEYILDKKPVGPRHIPKITFRSKALLVEFEDSPFEWKLSMIYRVGTTEQRHRLAREEAFRVKVKGLEETRQRQGSHSRSRSTFLRGRGSKTNGGAGDPSPAPKETAKRTRGRSSSRPGRRGRKMRYDPERSCGFSETAKISIAEARERLDALNFESWKKRIDFAVAYHVKNMAALRDVIWGPDELPDMTEVTETILRLPERPGLMTALINDLHVVIDQPSFPRAELPAFLHRIGKGMPYDMQYSLLVPVNVQLDMGEARVTLRDYPLPLLHVPAMRPNQSSRAPSWSLKTDFVIAEEYRDAESSRHVKVNIVPPDRAGAGAGVGTGAGESEDPRRRGFAIDVRRTVSPVKTYSDVEVSINTNLATRIAWGTSYQPAIQDMMMVIESFTKPQIDPSDRAGFWDKIRLGFHSRVHVAWTGDGDLQLLLKGSRNPYVVTGYGAGFVLCWRNDVHWRIAQDPDPRKFMTVDSGEFILAVPDLSHQARDDIVDPNASRLGDDGDSVSSAGGGKDGAIFKKVVMKLSGDVRWLAGLVFERDVDASRRSFDFRPHYEVTMKNPKFARASSGEVYDAYRGFRSQHIHLSIAVIAPVNRDWSVTNLQPSASYNTVHLSPRFHTHFFDWWSLFSGIMSLPVRQGRLWPGLEKSSKKFGRHLATIKYNLLLSPLFISHIYKHKDGEDGAEEPTAAATGLKVRLDSFMLDLHQRREEFASQVKNRKNQMKTTAMRIHEAQLDFISADIRAVSARLAGTTADELKRASEDAIAAYQQRPSSIDLSRFTIPDKDYSWIDMDDFVELDWLLPTEPNPETSILPLAFTPRFTYFRQTDHPDSEGNDDEGQHSSPFGHEATHYCVMSQDNDPRRVQCDLIVERLASLQTQMENHERSMGEAQLKVVKDDYKDEALKEQYNMLKHHGEMLQRKRTFLVSMLGRMSDQTEPAGSEGAGLGEGLGNGSSDRPSESNPSSDLDDEPGLEAMDASPLADFASDFNNRFIVHNVQMKWNNALRNVILRYIHQVGQRRGFVYYMSRRAVKFILDIVEEQNKSKQRPEAPGASAGDAARTRAAEPTSVPGQDPEASVQERIQQLLGDAKKFVSADEAASPPTEELSRTTTDEASEHIAQEFTPQNSYHVRLIAPQIQLQSEKNAKTAVLVTAKGMQLKVIQIMDKDRVADDVSGLVQRRFSMDMDSVQFFVSSQKTFATHFLHMYSGTRYGTPSGSSWPPWVPMEVMFDFKIHPFGFSRVVHKTSASLRYDKYNTLRLKYNDELSNEDGTASGDPGEPESRMDQLWVDFPQIRAICDSMQYYAMYMIVLDLLLYSEPLEKVRSERLEKIMLASDFSDLRGAPEMVVRLQERIRQLREIKMQFQVNARYLDRQGWQDRLALEEDLASCEDELFFLMKAITTSQRKYDDRSATTALLKWSLSATDIVWHLVREKNEPLVEFQLQNASYERTDISDGSNENLVEVGRIFGLNLLPHALYPDMIAPYFDNASPPIEGREIKMIRVKWYMLEAIAGIPVMDHFEVNLFPLKVQLEREIGKRLFEYVFPGAGSSAFEQTGVSPFTAKNALGGTNGTNGPAMTERAEEEAETAETSTSEDLEVLTGTETLAARLRPTLSLTHEHHKHGAGAKKSRHSVAPSNDGHHFRIFSSQSRSRTERPSPASTARTPTSKRSAESLKLLGRRSTERSYTNLTGLTMTPANSDKLSEKPKRFGLQRTASKDVPHDEKSGKRSDDLTLMMNRASNYMTLAYVKIPSVVLCLSYKGRSERNIEDVHNFVFRMPILEYRNKTWSNLDLALHLKRDVIKALISHTGAIIGNKFSHHRPSRQQQSRLREVANNSSLLTMTSTSDTLDGISDGSSPRDSSPANGRSTSPGRHSLSGSYPSPVPRTESFASIPSSSVTLHGGGVSSDAASTHTVGSRSGHGFIHNKLSRHLTGFAHKARSSSSSGVGGAAAEEPEER